ncbi:dTMP kinase [Salinispira pacifica]|uniref:Thymidylate kinase n=1 Tax=Salinispira pacifica TaxID=1307761 RepID=V5WI28_9SPIO|nr:dTMP kinase [Salinispira pacifica]AHC15199.1 Thymidylate kinase [Salinispira pacifica]
MFGNSSLLKGLIVFEGLDGAGTTTQLRSLEARLEALKRPYYITFEPTDGAVGQVIRTVLGGKEAFQRETLARLFSADRYEHLHGNDGMIAHLDRGDLVITDRYLFSSLAYQGLDLGMEKVWEFNRDFPLPEILLFFDIPPEDGERRYSRRDSLEIYEKLSTQHAVRDNYMEILDHLKQSDCEVIIIDSTKSIDKISDQVWSIVSRHPIVTM